MSNTGIIAIVIGCIVGAAGLVYLGVRYARGATRASDVAATSKGEDIVKAEKLDANKRVGQLDEQEALRAGREAWGRKRKDGP